MKNFLHRPKSWLRDRIFGQSQAERTIDQECADIRQLCRKFGLMSYVVPGHISATAWAERLSHLKEELDELTVAASAQNLEEQADALVDLVYVAKRTAVMLGLPWEALWADVHRANMAKELGVGRRGFKVDLVKPKGWVGPKPDKILQDHGYNWTEWKPTKANLTVRKSLLRDYP